MRSNLNKSFEILISTMEYGDSVHNEVAKKNVIELFYANIVFFAHDAQTIFHFLAPSF